MFTRDMTIAGYDDELWTAMQSETVRQEEHIELIASENYTSPRDHAGARQRADQ